MTTYQRCMYCVMDNTSDKSIFFDENGVCNYCKQAKKLLALEYHPDDVGYKQFKQMCELLKKEGKSKKYDCLMGVSGGLDSSYLLYRCANEGLRILALHIDDGFDMPLAKSNILNLCKAAHVNLVEIKPDAEQFNDLTRAYILASVCNLAVPQDNVLFANIYKYAKENHLHYFLSGSNFTLESILEEGERYPAHDVVNIKDIHKKFGLKQINNIELMSYFYKKLISTLYRIKTIKPLNYIDYNKKRAISELNQFSGFEYYNAKHLENKLTKMIQLYWFYEKFGVDKRKSHLSSLIVSDQMTREEALEELEKEVYDRENMNNTIDEVLNVIGLSRETFDNIVHSPNHSHFDYKTSNLYNRLRKLKRK